MSIRTIHKQSSTSGPALINTPSDAGFIYDTVDGFIKYDDNGTTRALLNTSEAQTVTGAITFTATGAIRTASVTLTDTEFKAIRATPKELVAAPGAGFGLVFVGGHITIDYTAAYTESADNMAVKYTNSSGTIVSGTIEATGFVDATADSFMPMVAAAPTGAAVANAALVLHNTGDGEYGGGNAANVITVTTHYRIVTVP